MTAGRNLVKMLGMVLFFTLISLNSFAFDKNAEGGDDPYGYSSSYNNEMGEPQWGLNILYGEKGFGGSSQYYFNAWKNTDLFVGLSFSSVSDDREFTEYDIYGNSFTPDKVNRVFMVPFTLGLKHSLFRDEIDGSIRPTISAGVTPTLVLLNPYSKNYFAALGYFTTSYAMGGYVGVGMDFKQNENLAYSFNVSYHYLPVIGKEVMSLENRPINNLGGLQFTIGVNLLK